ncbi:hypothetical protein FAI40_06975 [Acetobacteraceae bacterium]|nr:hypothetical protein FAI40_06975 [Acetobacteraceae bacterium]
MSESKEDFSFFIEKSVLPENLALHVQNWVVQREAGKKPSFLKQDEINHLAFLAVTCLRQKALGLQKVNSWSPLLPVLENWVIQRGAGETPTKLTEWDCQDFVRLVLKALTSPIYVSAKEEEPSLPEKAEAEDPLHLLRQHLLLGL